jgi:hypothetical protein
MPNISILAPARAHHHVMMELSKALLADSAQFSKQCMGTVKQHVTTQPPIPTVYGG